MKTGRRSTGAGRRASSLDSAAVRALVQVVAAGLVLGSLELLSRAYFAVRHDIPFFGTLREDMGKIYDRSHPYLPVVLKKNSKLDRQEVTINNVGFRGPDVSVPKRAGTLRVATLGGSATWGHGVAQGLAWPRLLEQELRRLLPGRDVEVVNAGVPGYNSMESLLNLIMRVLPLEPDIVVVYHGWNDMKATTRAVTFERDYSDWRSRRNPHDNLRESILNRSRFMLALDILPRKLLPPRAEPVPDAGFVDRGQVSFFRKNLEHIVSLSRASGAIPVLGTHNLALDSRFVRHITFNTIALSPEGYRKMLAAYNAAIVEVAAREGAALADVDAALPDTEEMHSDICHLTVEGNRRVARVFAEAIVRRLGRGRPGPRAGFPVRKPTRASGLEN